jgi:DNA (cytosine-5)-methyltransferase 1
VVVGDVADESVWNPDDYHGIDLLAGGVPCPPFSIAGHQRGSQDERDLFAWAVELAGRIEPRALLLENVRGLSMPRFDGYRQHVQERLTELGYWSSWKVLEARNYGVPQLRPRFVLVALKPEYTPYFTWPEPTPYIGTVGSAIGEMMAAHGWLGAAAWASGANTIAPTIVGGSKKHGGADLGPTRARRAWAALGVNGAGVADAPPDSTCPLNHQPKLTTEMIARIQGWNSSPEYAWEFTGKKTSRARQIGNAFPPPVARAVGTAIRSALAKVGTALPEGGTCLRDQELHHEGHLYHILRDAETPLTEADILLRGAGRITPAHFSSQLADLGRDFEVHMSDSAKAPAYRLGSFRGFTGQQDHHRHAEFAAARARVS